VLHCATGVQNVEKKSFLWNKTRPRTIHIGFLILEAMLSEKDSSFGFYLLAIRGSLASSQGHGAI
jgi:hypothetical protein